MIRNHAVGLTNIVVIIYLDIRRRHFAYCGVCDVTQGSSLKPSRAGGQQAVLCSSMFFGFFR